MWWQINWSAKYSCCLIIISWEPLRSPDLPYWMPPLRKHQSSHLLFYYFNFESTQNVNSEKSNDLNIQASSVHFSRLVVRPHGLQHTRLPSLSPTPRVYTNSCPLSRWCLPAISSPVVPFSSCPQSFPASGSFQMSQLFASGGQSVGVSASTSVLPMNTQGWSLLGWTSPCNPRDSQESSQTPQFKSINSSALSFLYSSTLTSIHDYGKNHSLN